ncbi:uncharacterized protein LOC133839554 [Drosophila sulfurigaster albostrigata]|uniref:uncharacterized protein LOC133839554 n=1 Tax=Drosophila sulfurigaster albostrigata TaxID=89887 RepID=UPI002D21E4A8|nr:uncharacterized protein LOC133839554 [Drosophila sulfurigaster albostrigata]
MFSIRSLILSLFLLARHSGFWSVLASVLVCPGFIATRLAGLRCYLLHFLGWTLVALRWDFNLINCRFDSNGYQVCCPCDERPRRFMYRSTSIHSWRNSSTFTVSERLLETRS